jgi:hypothetical protein
MTTIAMRNALQSMGASLETGGLLVHEAIDAVVSAHEHGGKAAFDERIDHLRAVVTGYADTAKSHRDMALHVAGLPGLVSSEPVAPVTDSTEPEVAAAASGKGAGKAGV